MTDVSLDTLIGLIYEGPLETPPWQSALELLRDAMEADVVSLVLRPPAEGDRGAILNCLRPGFKTQKGPGGDNNDWELSAYREQFFALDPFVNLPLDTVVALQDLMPGKELTSSAYYRD